MTGFLGKHPEAPSNMDLLDADIKELNKQYQKYILNVKSAFVV